MSPKSAKLKQSLLLLTTVIFHICRNKYLGSMLCWPNVNLYMYHRRWTNKVASTIASKFMLFSVSGFKDEKLIKKQTYVKTITCKLYSRDFWIFLPNIIKIDHCNSELYRFKVGAFFETQCISYQWEVTCGWFAVDFFHGGLNSTQLNSTQVYLKAVAERLKRYNAVQWTINSKNAIKRTQYKNIQHTHTAVALFLLHQLGFL